MAELIIEPEAEAELEEAGDRYEESVPGLGLDFLLEMRERALEIADAPHRYPVFGGVADVRCAHAVGRFPHLIVYMPFGDAVHALAFNRREERPVGLPASARRSRARRPVPPGGSVASSSAAFEINTTNAEPDFGGVSRKLRDAETQLRRPRVAVRRLGTEPQMLLKAPVCLGLCCAQRRAHALGSTKG